MKKFTKFDNLAESILNEGLITSYDIQKLKSTLEKKFGTEIKIVLPKKDDLVNHNFNYHAYTFTVYSKSKNLHLLQQQLDLFGYFINKQKPYDNSFNVYQIEPKYPIKINQILIKKKITYFYHITPNKHLIKIQKIGLTPRQSKTDFNHTDNRIYLMSGEIEKLKGFFTNIAKAKSLSLNEMTVFKIPFNNKYNYYLDDMATFLQPKYNMIAVFIMQNILPNELEIIKL